MGWGFEPTTLGSRVLHLTNEPKLLLKGGINYLNVDLGLGPLSRSRCIVIDGTSFFTIRKLSNFPVDIR